MATVHVLASCPACKKALRITIGRKSTARRVVCPACRAAYGYSAWKLATPRAGGDTIDLRTFYQVDLFPESV